MSGQLRLVIKDKQFFLRDKRFRLFVKNLKEIRVRSGVTLDKININLKLSFLRVSSLLSGYLQKSSTNLLTPANLYAANRIANKLNSPVFMFSKETMWEFRIPRMKRIVNNNGFFKSSQEVIIQRQKINEEYKTMIKKLRIYMISNNYTQTTIGEKFGVTRQRIEQQMNMGFKEGRYRAKLNFISSLKSINVHKIKVSIE